MSNEQSKPAGWPTDDMVVRGAEELHDSLRMFGIDINFDTKTKGTEIQQEIVEAVFNAMLAAAPKAAVPDGMVLVDKRSLGTVLQALVNAPHHIRELQATREPAALFKDNPINVLIANYEADPAQPQNKEGEV